MALDEARVRERFAAALREQRILRRRPGDGEDGLPQPEMAAILDVSPRQYQRYEAGESMPRGWKDLQETAESLEVTVSYLVGEDVPVLTMSAAERTDRVATRLADLIERGETLADRLEALQSVEGDDRV